MTHPHQVTDAEVVREHRARPRTNLRREPVVVKTPTAMVSEITGKLHGIDGYQEHGWLRVAEIAKTHGLSTKEALAEIEKVSYLKFDRHGRLGYCVLLVDD